MKFIALSHNRKSNLYYWKFLSLFLLTSLLVLWSKYCPCLCSIEDLLFLLSNKYFSLLKTIFNWMFFMRAMLWLEIIFNIAAISSNLPNLYKFRLIFLRVLISFISGKVVSLLFEYICWLLFNIIRIWYLQRNILYFICIFSVCSVQKSL